MRSRRDARALATPRGALLLGCAVLVLWLGSAPAAPARTVVSVTFDDGSADQYAVRAMLAERGMHATFYINSGQVGSSSYYMDWPQLHELYADGHEIGGHTLHHAPTAGPSADAQRPEVCQDRTNLLAQGFAATSFAYAYGTDTLVRALAQGCGYNAAQLAGGLRWGSGCLRCPPAEALPPRDPYHLRTVEIHAGDTGSRLAGYVADADADADAGGRGWVIFPFNRVCDGCSAYGIAPAELRDFLRRLSAMVSDGRVEVATIQQVIGGDLQPDTSGTPLPPPQAGSGIGSGGRDTIRPSIVRLSVSPRRIAVTRRGNASGARVSRRATFRYVLSEPARVRFRFERKATAQRARGGCKRPNTSPQVRPGCRRFVPVGSFSRSSDRLANHFRFTGRIGDRALRTGRHRVVVRAIDGAGNRSRARVLHLTVVGAARR